MLILPPRPSNKIAFHHILIGVMGFHILVLGGLRIYFSPTDYAFSPNITFIGDILFPVDFVKVKYTTPLLPQNILLNDGTRRYTNDFAKVDKSKITALNNKTTKRFSKPLNYPERTLPPTEMTSKPAIPNIQPVIYKPLKLENP